MKTTQFRMNTAFHPLAIVAVACCLACPVRGLAQTTLSWTSHDLAVDPSNNTLWSNAANWSEGIAPVDGDILRFPQPATNGSRATSNDLSNLVVGGIVIPANAYTIGGNGFNLAGNISFTAGGNSTFGVGVPVTLQQTVTLFNEKTTAQTPIFSFNANVTGPFGVTLDATTTGGQTAINANTTYTGDTTVTNGNLYLRTGVIYSGVTPGNLTIGAAGSVLSNNLSFSAGGLNGTGGLSKSGSNTRTLTLGGNNADGAHGGIVSWTGGSSSITKTGTGTQTLSGAVTVSAGGAINGGRLNVDGSWNSGMTVNAAGTLGGSGTLGGAVTGSGTVSPGSGLAIGSLTAGSATLSGTLQVDLDGTAGGTSDLFAVSGALNIGSATLNFNQLTPVDDQTYVFASYGSLVGTFASVTNMPDDYTIDYAYQGNTIALTLVPEPGAVAGLAALVGLAGLVGRRRWTSRRV